MLEIIEDEKESTRKKIPKHIADFPLKERKKFAEELGLPGFSGFVAEMTVFMGSWQNPDGAYRLATVLSGASIVVTAVYILRATGRAIMGPISNEHAVLADATWNEKLAAVLLIAGILVIGLAPFLINHLIMPSTDAIMLQMGKAIVAK